MAARSKARKRALDILFECEVRGLPLGETLDERVIAGEPPVNEYTVTLIRGPSGSGKSSLLAALRGAASFEGSSEFGGHEVTALDPSRWFAWAGQQPGLVTGTIADNVALGDPSRDTAAVVRALTLAGADALDPDRLLGVHGAGLSGGQAQRVAVARAFYRRLRGLGPVVALDEPSAALDAQTRDLMQTELLQIWERTNKTVLFVTHSIEEAAYLSDRVIVMTARPGRTKEVLRIDLPRPRDYEMRLTPKFNEIKLRIWEVLKEELTSRVPT